MGKSKGVIDWDKIEGKGRKGKGKGKCCGKKKSLTDPGFSKILS